MGSKKDNRISGRSLRTGPRTAVDVLRDEDRGLYEIWFRRPITSADVKNGKAKPAAASRAMKGGKIVTAISLGPVTIRALRDLLNQLELD